MDFETVVAQRHSVRSYKPEPVPMATIRKIVETANAAPSWCDSQSWKVYVATGATLETIRAQWIELNEKGVKGRSDLPAGHRTDFDDRAQRNMQSLFEVLPGATDDPELTKFSRAQFTLANAPALVYLALGKGSPCWGLYDLGGFGAMLMLAAKNLGVDSLVAYEFIKYPDVLRPALGVSDSEDIVMGIALGYPTDDKLNAFRSPRQKLDDFLVVRE